jgi:hypothetical protein
MTVGIILFITVELILVVLICWFVGGRTGKPGHGSIQQVCFPKKYHLPITIRPPPVMACAFKNLSSKMYS